MASDTPSNDPLAPSGNAQDAFAGPIACVTVITKAEAETRHFYTQVMEMSVAEELSTPPARQTDQRTLWGLPEDFQWDEIVFNRPALPDTTLLRVLSSEQAGPPVRPGLNVLLEGGLSVGFAMHDMAVVVEHGKTLGYDTTAGITTLDMKRTDGSPYQALECHFKAPDDVYALGVGRPRDLAPVGPIEEGHTVGGPSYTGQIMNHCDETLRFYTEVLGYEVRNRTSLPPSGPEGGLIKPPGTESDFVQVFAPGSTTGYFIVLDYGDKGMSNSHVAPPSSGVVMWTIPVKSISEVMDKAPSTGCSIMAGPLETETPYFGKHRAVTIKTANGFLVECIER